MARLDPSLKHAITPPAFDANKLHRERLVDAIHGEIARKLVVIAAPAGYGKTTLLADFAAHTEIPVCWLGLTEADRDVMRLASVLLAALEKRFRRLKNQLDLRALADASPEALALSFVSLIDSHVEEAFVLLIDEVDVINQSESGRTFLDEFLDRLPDQVTVVCAGREVLEVSLAKLMADGRLAGFGPHDLALTREELKDLAHEAFHEELEDTDLERILDETKGWITGVVMSGVLGGRSLRSIGTRPRPMVYEYLASVVLNRQPEGLRQFMLSSSVLPVMSAHSCSEVLGEPNAGKFLEQLMADGLFITATGDDPITYEYHPLFRRFLIETKSASDHDAFEELCSRAAAHLKGEGEIEEAVQALLLSGRTDAAAELAESWANEAFEAGKIETLEDWAAQFKVEKNPDSQIRILLAVSHADRGRLDDARRLVEGIFDTNGGSPRGRHSARAAALLGALAFDEGDIAEAESWLRRAEDLNSKVQSTLVTTYILRYRALLALRQGQLDAALSLARACVENSQGSDSNSNDAYAYQSLVTIQVASGRLHEARQSALKALEIASREHAHIPIAISLNNLATIEHNMGYFEEALGHYAESLEHAKQAASTLYEASVYLGQADLFRDLGLRLQAAELYGEALTLMANVGDRGWTEYICVQTAVLHRRSGGLATAHEWLKRAIEVGEHKEYPPRIRIQLAALELSASPQNATATLSKLLEDERLEPADRIVALYFRARARQASGDSDGARANLGSALESATAHSLEQVLASEIQSDNELLDLGSSSFGDSTGWAILEKRIETMERISAFYLQSQGKEVVPVEGVQLDAFGQAIIRQNGEEVTGLKPQVRELLFYLADQTSASNDTLKQVFWPDHPPGRQTANLHMAVYSLRNAFGKDFVCLDGAAYSLSRETDIAYDVARFERASKIAQSLAIGDPRRLFALTEAIGLYDGPFLLEFEDQWVIERRRDLEMLYLSLVSQHADEALMRDQPNRALQYLEDALLIDPYSDDLNLRYILLLGRLDRRSAMVAHYQRYVTLLSSDLGLDPSEEVREAYSRMIG